MNEPRDSALAETGKVTFCNCKVEVRRMKTAPPDKKAASDPPSPNSPKLMFEAGALRGEFSKAPIPAPVSPRMRKEKELFDPEMPTARLLSNRPFPGSP